jgi:hypothetical protein
MKIRYLFISIAFVLAIILGISRNVSNTPKREKLESRTKTSTISLNEKSGIRMSMGPFKIVNIPVYHIDPNLLKIYKVQYDYNLPELKGKVLESKYGYIKDNNFIEPAGFFCRHIEKPEDIFSYPGYHKYMWEIKARKPSKLTKTNFVKEYPNGFRLDLRLKGEPNVVHSYVFPVEDNGREYTVRSITIVPVFNKGINGIYKNSDLKVSDANNPLSYLCSVYYAEVGSRFLKP